MPTYNYLPGTQALTIDGGMVARRVPSSKATVIVGTSGIGPANDIYPVVDRAVAAQAFGLDGTLIQAMEEVASGGCDNITLFRMGTSPAALANVGASYLATTATGTSGQNTITVVSATGVVVGQTITSTVPSAIPAGTTITAVSGMNLTLSAALGADLSAGNVTIGPITAGFTIQFGEVASTTGGDYKLWYNAGVLYVWLNSNLVFANDTANSLVVDTGDLSIFNVAGAVQADAVTGNAGLQIGSGVSGSLTGAVTLTVASTLTGTTASPAPTYTAAVTGLGLTGRQIYIALAKALDLLQTVPTEVLYAPNAVFDQPNVAFYVPADATTATNNPVTNADALDWLKVTKAADGTLTYQWAHDSVDSNGVVATPMSAATPADRLDAGFYEVHFPYLLATFCQQQEYVGENGTCIAFIGAKGPGSYALKDLRKWVGYLPTYNLSVANQPTAPGSGLLGLPLLAGTTSAKLNSLCHDYANGYRTNGLFLTAEGQYDGTVLVDTNGNNIDIGAYLHLFADYSAWSNGFSTNYVANGAGWVAGYYSTLDARLGLTFKPATTAQLWKASFPQMDALTEIGVNILRYQGPGNLPVLLHGDTLATSFSDYINLLRQSIKGLVIETIRSVANSFIGKGSLDGLTQQGLITALTKAFTNLQKNGYVSAFSFAVTTTAADQKLGHASIQVTFTPANELVQLKATVGVGQQ